ncbi:MAG: polysaccharide biosynthesis/export family protein [Bacteroidales bacterium]|nr:polysaccharide biosynthesis/export family protein [Bacteroidales bacterium]
MIMTKDIVRAAFFGMAVAFVLSCSTPTNIAYFQDATDAAVLTPAHPQTIRLKPMDQVSIIVNSRDPQVTAMFNLPYYTNRIGTQQTLTSSAGTGSTLSTASSISGYTVDSDGNVDFPVIGQIHLSGLTREEAERHIKELLIESKQIKDPVVTVEFMNLGFSVLGEVARPGRYKIDRDRFTLLDAIGLAGDLTINGERESVTLVRHDGKKDHVYKVNLLDLEQVYQSPAFYLQQGDVIYVKPNDKRIRESTINGNNVRSTSFWISLSSLVTSVTSLIINVARK